MNVTVAIEDERAMPVSEIAWRRGHSHDFVRCRACGRTLPAGSPLPRLDSPVAPHHHCRDHFRGRGGTVDPGRVSAIRFFGDFMGREDVGDLDLTIYFDEIP